MRDKTSSNLRSRSMAGVEQLVHKDPRLWGKDNVKGTNEMLMDTSPKVRESTLNFVATCLTLNPALESTFLPVIIQLADDNSNGPKKRAIKLLKDIYNGTSSKDNQLRIIASLLMPTQDDEKAIADLSRNVLEEMLLTFTKSGGKRDENQLQLERAKRSTFIIDVVQHIQQSPTRLEAFEKFFIYALSDGAKATETNFGVCKDLVADMCDQVISTDSGSDAKSQSRILNALSIFAKVQPSLFTVDQIKLLKLYIKSINTTDEIYLLGPTVIIFRYVIATLPSLQQEFAMEVRTNLAKNAPTLATWTRMGYNIARETLIDVAHCLWAVTPMVPQGPAKLCTMVASMICELHPMASNSTDPTAMARDKGKIMSLLILLGTLGKVCKFDQYPDIFRERLTAHANAHITATPAKAPLLKPLLAPKLDASLVLLQAVRSFTTQTWDMDVRTHALRSLGGICYQSPALFERAEVKRVYQLTFINVDSEQLKFIALSTFLEYLNVAERRSETGAVIAVGQGAQTGNARLETSFVASAGDSVPMHFKDWFLKDFVEFSTLR